MAQHTILFGPRISRWAGLVAVSLLLGGFLFGKGYSPSRISFIDGKACYEPAGAWELHLERIILRVNECSGYYVLLPASMVRIEKKGFYRVSGDDQGDSQVLEFSWWSDRDSRSQP